MALKRPLPLPTSAVGLLGRLRKLVHCFLPTRHRVGWQWVRLGWLMSLASGPLLAQAQNVSASDSLRAVHPLTTLAADSPKAPRTPYPSLLAKLEQADAQRLAHVAVLRVRNPSNTDSTSFRLNDEVILEVRDLRLALRRARRPSSDLRLYVDDVSLPMPPLAVDTIRHRNVATVRFQLVRNAATEPIWQLFYKVPGKYEHPSTFNVGFDTGQLGRAYPAGSTRLHLQLVQAGWLVFGLVLLALLGWAFGWLVLNTNFIRSDLSGRIPLDAAGLASVRSERYRQVPYSLAKSQVAFWTLLVVAAYLMISLVTLALPIIPTGLLGLLGISIANGLFSSFLNRPAADAGGNTTKSEQVDNIGLSRGWFSDVLTDATGVSVVRLQFVVFNVIAGLYMVRHVLLLWSLPDFDSSILTLISISSAGFLVQKNSESSAQKDANAQLPRPTPSPAGGGPELNERPRPATTGTGETPAATTSATTAKAAAGPHALLATVAPPAADPAAARQDWERKLAKFRASPVVYNSDPGRVIFGDLSSAANGYQLDVSLVAVLRGGLDLQATVTSSRDTPLAGTVVFLLHPTYQQRVATVPVVRGQAVLRFFSAGCYTLIAMLDEGETVLAFNLFNVKGAPSSFLEN